MSIEGVQSAIIDVVPRAAISAVLRPGQTLQGTIESAPGGLSVVISGVRVPVAATSGLMPGQTVTVDVTGSGGRLQLRVTPISDSGGEGLGGPRLSALISAVLGALGGDARATETVAQLLPANLPLSESAVRSLVSMFVTRASTGADLETIAQMVAQASAAGVLPGEQADEIVALVSGLLTSRSGNEQTSDFRPALQRLASQAGTTAEGRIARALAAGTLADVDELLRTELPAALGRLTNNEAFTGHLRAIGRLGAFEQAAERVLDRLSAGQLQNLRGLEQPYVFFEIPFVQDAFIREARVHFFGEERGGQRRFSAANAHVTLDLSTTRLGDLWITLQMVDGRCSCHFRATAPAAVEAIEAAAGDLETALTGAGYSVAAVHVTLWDGDRLRETANLMRRFRGIDLKA